MTGVVLEAPEQHPQQALAPVNVQPDVLQLSLPITVVLVGTHAGAARMLRQRRYRRPGCCARAGQLEIQWDEPARHAPRAPARQASRCRPRRQRPVRPHAAADSLALEHMDLAEKIAGNFARRTIHPKEDLLQLAMIGLIKAARRYDPSRGPFRPYGRTYANGEITHFLRDNGFLIKVPPTWRELHARGQRLLASGVDAAHILEHLCVSRAQWQHIVEACSIRVVALPVD
jgi:DNA-directed RNA polymerase sigma subunit (sigma70/sigma32)